MSMITAAQIAELATARYSDLAVLSRDKDGNYRVEPQSTAAQYGRTAVCDAGAVEDWSGGEPMTDADCEQYAAEVNRELAERGDA
jgi:hypothetical protein